MFDVGVALNSNKETEESKLMVQIKNIRLFPGTKTETQSGFNWGHILY